MSKKMMLLALAVAALFALPSAASAQEIHFLNGASSFSGSGGTGTLQATNEPKITCTATSVSGGFTGGSTTTGEVKLTFTGCTAELLGIKGNCNTTGDVAQTITSSGVFHLITYVNAAAEKKPAILVTPITTTILCVGFSRTEVTGKGIIGTITSPACEGSGTEMKVSFESTGSTQNHIEYTGVKYDLSADTENSEGSTLNTVTAGLTGSAVIKQAAAGTLQCT